MKFGSIKTRLTLWNVGVLAFILIGFALSLHQLSWFNLINSVDNELEHRYEWELSFVFFRFDPQQFHERAKRFADDDKRWESEHRKPPPGPPPSLAARQKYLMANFQHLVLLTPQGYRAHPFSVPKPWDAIAFARSLKGATIHESVSLEKLPFRLYSKPVRYKGQIIAVYQFIRPLDDVNQAMRNLDRTLIMIIVPALIVAGLSGAFLTNRSLQPVRRISQAASRLAAKDLSMRLPVTGADEFSELSANFNSMAERLESAFQNLESAYRDLNDAYERQRRFTADASHELRTPLTAIKANASLALTSENDADFYREALTEIDFAANSMKRIVDDLLFLARADNESVRLDRKPLLAKRIIDATISEASRNWPDSRAETDGVDPNLVIRVDSYHFNRLLLNLLDNAMRHTPSEGWIRVSAYEEDSQFVLIVKDEGEGIAPEHLPHVFERFYRADVSRSREAGGAGLGLSICQSIVRAHSGTIRIESEPGCGATVTVILPDAIPEEDVGAEDSTAPFSMNGADRGADVETDI